MGSLSLGYFQILAFSESFLFSSARLQALPGTIWGGLRLFPLAPHLLLELDLNYPPCALGQEGLGHWLLCLGQPLGSLVHLMGFIFFNQIIITGTVQILII